MTHQGLKDLGLNTASRMDVMDIIDNFKNLPSHKDRHLETLCSNNQSNSHVVNYQSEVSIDQDSFMSALTPPMKPVQNSSNCRLDQENSPPANPPSQRSTNISSCSAVQQNNFNASTSRCNIPAVNSGPSSSRSGDSVNSLSQFSRNIPSCSSEEQDNYNASTSRFDTPAVHSGTSSSRSGRETTAINPGPSSSRSGRETTAINPGPSSSRSGRETTAINPGPSSSRSGGSTRTARELPPDDDPGFVDALNAAARVDRLVSKAYEDLQVKYDVETILTDGRNGLVVINELNKGYIIGSNRTQMTNILISHLFESVPNPALVSTAMREAMAICLVQRWPSLKSKMYKKGDRPWYDWYNPNENMGCLNHCVQTKHRSLKKRGQGIRKTNSSKKPRPLKEIQPNCGTGNENEDDPESVDHVKDMNELTFLNPSGHEKRNILHLMAKTFHRRRQLFGDKDFHTHTILLKYPHLLSYNGEVIEQEFSQLHRGKDRNLYRNFIGDFIPKLLKLAVDNPTKYILPFADDTLNAIVALSKFLPVPRRVYEHEEKMPLHPAINELLYVVPLGSDPQEEARKKRDGANYPIQPYLMLIGNPKALGKMYIVAGDGKVMDLGRSANPTNGLDLLFKTFHVLSSHYPLGWKNCLRFLQVHIYHIPPENPRESKFDAQLRALMNS